jgi:hypothetical protein
LIEPVTDALLEHRVVAAPHGMDVSDLLVRAIKGLLEAGGFVPGVPGPKSPPSAGPLGVTTI